MNDLPPEVTKEILSVLDEDFVDPPPSHAFTLVQYYEEYRQKMRAAGREEDCSALAVMRTKLNKKVASGELKAVRWPSHQTKYYWKEKEPPI